MTEKTVEKSHSITYRYADGHLGTTRTISVHASPEEIQHFVEQGVLYRDRLFPAGPVSRLRLALDEVAEMERTRGNADSTDARFGGLFIRHLYDKHPEFLELIDYPPMVSVARALLETCCPEPSVGPYQCPGSTQSADSVALSSGVGDARSSSSAGKLSA